MSLELTGTTVFSVRLNFFFAIKVTMRMNCVIEKVALSIIKSINYRLSFNKLSINQGENIITLSHNCVDHVVHIQQISWERRATMCVGHIFFFFATANILNVH